MAVRKRSGVRDRVAASKQATKLVKRAALHLKRARAAKTCETQVNHALDALRFAAMAAENASGYRTFRLPQALNIEQEARDLTKACMRKRRRRCAT